MGHKEIADASDARAKRTGVDPPRQGRKTYNQRYTETSKMSNSEIETLIAQRKANGQECGVLHRVLANRGE